MIKRFSLTIFFILAIIFSANADMIDVYFDYGVDSEINEKNLDGNLNNIRTVVNGNLDNDNSKDDFFFVEKLSSLPLAGTEGRVAYLTTSDTLNFDDGTEWWTNPNYSGTASQGDILYYNGTNWARVTKGTDGEILITGNTPSWSGLGDNEFSGILTTNDGGTGQDFSATVQGSILYFSATGTVSALGTGTSGHYLQTKGASDNPVWASAESYFKPDGVCVLAVDNGSLGVDLSSLNQTLTLASLADADLVAGKVSSKCYDYDGTNDYITVADNAVHDVGTSLYFEVWVYKDTAGTDFIISDDGAGANFSVSMGDASIVVAIKTGDGDEAASVAHGLSDSGLNQWAYIVVQWDNSTHADVYVNGSDVGDGDDAGNGSVNGFTGFCIGADTSQGNHFPGKIDGLRLLKTTKTAAQILARYNAFK